MRGKTVLLCLLFLLAGLTAGLTLNLTDDPASAVPSDTALFADDAVTAQLSAVLTPAPTPEPGNVGLLSRAVEAAELIRDWDYAGLAQLVHPVKGVTFTPYSTVDLEANLNFSPSGLTDARMGGAEYIWGLTDGQGEPISLTVDDYFDQYVFNADYTQAPEIGINQVIGSGNSLENVAEAYPEAQFVEFHFPGLEAANQGFDWCSLKLVFESYNGAYMLVGVIHSQWTI